MPYRIAIIDDNPIDIAYVTTLVERWSQNRHTCIHMENFPSAEAFLFLYSGDKAWDILLLDIEMGETNGIELAKMIRQENNNIQIIFITGYPDFISEGYDVSALHYLMKPVSEEKLYTVLDKAILNLNKSEKSLCIAFNRQTEYVPLSQIYYIEAQRQYIAIYTNEKTYRMKASLSDTEKLLDEYFFKCQRSFLVNLRFVKRITPTYIILNNNAEIPISRGMAEKIGKEIIRLF